MEVTNVDPVITQAPASPVQTDNLAGMTSADIAKQIEVLQQQTVSAPAVEPGINQEVAQPVPEAVAEPTPVTQAEPEQRPVEPVGLEEIERLRKQAEEAEILRQRYADSSREAVALAARNRELEAQTKQIQEQQRRYTDEEVDAFVEQNPQYSNWGREYKKESIIIEAEARISKKQEEREQKIRYNTESTTALERAKQEFPDAFKSGTPMQKLAAEIYASRPAFKSDPQGVYFAAELAKARLIPASKPITTQTVPSQAQPAANTPFVEKGNSIPASARIDLNNLSPEAVAKMSLADLAKILPKVDQY